MKLLEDSHRLISRLAEGDAFLIRIFTCEETWVHPYTPDSKQASKEWQMNGEATPVKVKNQLPGGERFLQSFFIYFYLKMHWLIYCKKLKVFFLGVSTSSTISKGLYSIISKDH